MLHRLGGAAKLEFHAFRMDGPVELGDVFGKHIDVWMDVGSREMLIYDLLRRVDVDPERREIIHQVLFGHCILDWATPVDLNPYLYVVMDQFYNDDGNTLTVLVFNDQRQIRSNRWS